MKLRLHIVWIGILLVSCAPQLVVINPIPLDIPHAPVVGSKARVGPGPGPSACLASDSCSSEPDYCLASPHAEGCPADGDIEWASDERAPL